MDALQLASHPGEDCVIYGNWLDSDDDGIEIEGGNNVLVFDNYVDESGPR